MGTSKAMRETEMFELVELDPETGKEDHCLSIRPTTWTEASRHMDRVLLEMAEDWDTEFAVWPWLIIQPAQ